MDSSNAEKAWNAAAQTREFAGAALGGLTYRAFMVGHASRDAEVAELLQALAESRARFADSEARRAELEAVIKEALNAMTHGWAARKALDVVHAILHSKPSVVLEDRDRENRAIGVEAAQDRLVNRDQFSSRTLELLDELAAEYRGDNR